MNITFERVVDSAKLPERATKGSAGFDAHAAIEGRTILMFNEDNVEIQLKATNTVEIPGHWRALIPLGFKAKMPEGYECQVRPRSGLALKKGVTVHNGPGTIDSDYADEWGVILINESNAPFLITDGDRICQLVFAKTVDVTWADGKVTKTTRKGGFGSTGK